MSDKTGIEWTDATWNPTKGCDRVSAGCDHCYAMTLAPRLKAMGSPAYQLDGDPRTSGPGFLAHEWPDVLDQPLRWTRPRRIFVNSMSDLFHDNISDEYIAKVFAVMAAAPQHTFQILTKRHARMRSLLRSGDFFAAVWDDAVEACGLAGISWPLPNVWLGVSVETQQWADIRIPALFDTPAAVRFLSCEPLLGLVDLSRWLPRSECTCGHAEMAHYYGPRPICGCRKLRGERDHGIGDPYENHGLHWVIVGGESGPGARPMHPDWARSLRVQCQAAGVPFLFKQWGEWVGHAQGGDPSGNGRSPWADRDVDAYIDVLTGQPSETDGRGMWRVGKKAAGRELDGRTWDEYPA